MKRKLNLTHLSMLAVLGLLSACGEKGGSEASGITSTFIDAPVKGLNIVKASGNTKTQDGGKFSCASGETVGFYLRDLYLGSAPCGEKIFVTDIAESTTATGIAAVLQSLSKTNISGTDGLIDLSAIPDNAAIATHIPDLTAAGILTTLGPIRSQATDSLQPVPANLAAVISHVEQSISTYSPASESLKTYAGKTIPVKADYVSGCTDTAKCGCYESYLGDLEVKSVGDNGISAQIVNVKVCDFDYTDENDCFPEDSSPKRIITSTTFNLVESRSEVLSVATPGVMKSTGIDGKFEYYCVDSDYDYDLFLCLNIDGKWYWEDETTEITNFLPIASAGNFPFTANWSMTTSLNLSGTAASPIVKGVISEKYLSPHITSYTSENNYTFVKSNDSCTYAVTNR